MGDTMREFQTNKQLLANKPDIVVVDKEDPREYQH